VELDFANNDRNGIFGHGGAYWNISLRWAAWENLQLYFNFKDISGNGYYQRMGNVIGLTYII
jgi:hypothetical protein